MFLNLQNQHIFLIKLQLQKYLIIYLIISLFNIVININYYFTFILREAESNTYSQMLLFDKVKINFLD